MHFKINFSLAARYSFIRSCSSALVAIATCHSSNFYGRAEKCFGCFRSLWDKIPLQTAGAIITQTDGMTAELWRFWCSPYSDSFLICKIRYFRDNLKACALIATSLANNGNVKCWFCFLLIKPLIFFLTLCPAIVEKNQGGLRLSDFLLVNKIAMAKSVLFFTTTS